MVTLEDAVIARYTSHGENFEILVDPDKTSDIRSGDRDMIMDSVVIDTVFTDARKGLRASEETLKDIFGTDNFFEIAKKIVMEGEIHLTTEQRRAMMSERKKQIVAIISREGINPQTNTPHPPSRIELAMEEAKVKIDPFREASRQVKDIVRSISLVIPIKFEKMKIAIRINASFVGKVYGDILHFGKLLKEEYNDKGIWIGVVEFPAGLKNEFFDRLNEKLHGNMETKILK